MSLVNFIAQFKQVIGDKVEELLKSEFHLQELERSLFKFETPPDEDMGNLAFACFPLARVIRKSPQVIAQTLAQNWGETEYFQKIAAAGPYLNFFFSPDYLARELIPHCIKNNQYGDNDLGVGKTLMLEYSAPNTNKPLHLGHGRNNQLGTVLSQLLKRCGYQVIKTNLVNDRGVHICKSMLSYERWGQGETPENSGVKGDKLVGNYYVLFDKKEKETPGLQEEVQQMLRDWEDGDPKVVQLWQKMNSWVLEGFQQTYDRMGITFDKYYFESETYQGGKELVQEALEKGICYTEPNGAVAIDLESDKLGKKILLRGDGTSVYVTQDINTTVTKFSDFDLNGCLFVVASEQENHFRVLFKILSKFGYQWADNCEHISYGMCNLPEGKMKSREGTAVDLDDLLDEMNAMALEELKLRYVSKNDQTGINMLETAEAIGQAAIKFFILRTNVAKDIVFDPKESLSFDGATGPYLQYTHARICSLLKKASFDPTVVSTAYQGWSQIEKSLLVSLTNYPEIIRQSAADRNPAVLCGYIYDICRSFNKFYNEHQILKAENDEVVHARICLSRALQAVLNKTLKILGITALERM